MRNAAILAASRLARLVVQTQPTMSPAAAALIDELAAAVEQPTTRDTFASLLDRAAAASAEWTADGCTDDELGRIAANFRRYA